MSRETFLLELSKPAEKDGKDQPCYVMTHNIETLEPHAKGTKITLVSGATVDVVQMVPDILKRTKAIGHMTVLS